MCGIAGIFNRDLRPCQRDEIQPLIDTLAHRGPDGDGVQLDGPVGLGHRRLAILDLSDSGKQPMQFRGRFWITYNGEIFNFVEIQRELAALGVRFLTGTDTEVILAAYEQWGADCVLKFNGMWAFAIWDSHTRELFLSRDRFGIKPLHFLSGGQRFVFASELKSFLHLEGFCARENTNEMRRQLAGLPTRDQTLIEGVQLLPPGHNLTVTQDGIRMKRWWCTLDHLSPVPRRFCDQVEQFRELFLDACRLRMRSDVPVATCLSGGLDSSAILCSLATTGRPSEARFTSDYHQAFVATFPGTENDERAYAQAAATSAGANAHFYPMDAGKLAADFEQFTCDMEFVSPGLLLPVWALYRELRRNGVVVSLDGLGADELLMGYGAALRYQLNTHGNLLRHPLRTLDVARTVQRQFPGDESVGRLLLNSDPTLGRAAAAGRRLKRFLRPLPQRRRPSQPRWYDPPEAHTPAFDSEELAALQHLTPMNRDLYRQFHSDVNQKLLRRYDCMSMAHGVEVRLPFLDWRLVTFAFSLPDESKAGGGFSKRILREAMKGILPETIRTRTVKIGFQAPAQNWMDGQLGDWVWERVQTPRFLKSNLLDGEAIREFVRPRYAAHRWSRADARVVLLHLQADILREHFFAA